tara:strand:- start:4502 stop:4915 length:414 start_codon:yes stop_codon:yes gene_type:complete
MKPMGHNPIRWLCKQNGCYLTKCHPKIEEFAGCFPGKTAMSDIDGVIEINGYFMFMEWKGDGGRLHLGQEILLQQLTRVSDKIVAYVLYGNSVTMEVQMMTRIYGGRSETYRVSLEQVKDLFRKWTRMATYDFERRQ